jgi:hypothetical protein
MASTAIQANSVRDPSIRSTVEQIVRQVALEYLGSEQNGGQRRC